MTKSTPARYLTKNWKSYNEALKRRGSLLVWLDRDMVWLAPKAGRPGRPPVFSDAAVQFCLMVKAILSLPLRQIEPGSATGPRPMAKGITFLGDGEWLARKHGTHRRR